MSLAIAFIDAVLSDLVNAEGEPDLQIFTKLVGFDLIEFDCQSIKATTRALEAPMATVTTRVDDLDGSTEGVETVRLSLGDRTIEIDLASANRDKLVKNLAPFFDKGREVVKKQSSGNGETAVIRQWLQENGQEVNDKGRIPEDKVALYRAAHPSTPTQ